MSVAGNFAGKRGVETVMRHLLVVLAFGAAGVTVEQAAELPVKTVTLYKHGVGYFERQGTVAAGEQARIEFKSGEMNDVLKSITVTDQNGKVTGLRYDSSVPVVEKLADFPFTIGEQAALSALIDQLKGARVELEFGSQKMAGTVVSARKVEASEKTPEREMLTLLLDSGEMRSVDLAAASAVRFADPVLQRQFRDYLAAVSAARSTDRRSLYIDSTDAGTRNLRAEYIIPMPAWKSSYRLMLESAGGQGLLEGWGIVDNTTGEDWTNVHLSLVSGKPISFVSQLYPPKYIARETAELAEDKAVAPQLFGGNVQGVVGGVPGGARLMAAAPAPPPPPAQFSVGGLSSPSTVEAPGPATEIADLFEYSVKGTVSVRRDESAMFPFLQQKLAVRKLDIYSDATKANPLSAAELTNITGQTLDGGPITVYDAGAYAGEALVETVKAGDKRFIAYGVDLGTRAAVKDGGGSVDVREVHFHRGVMVTKSAQVDKRTYVFQNADARAKTVMVEHRIRPGFELVNTAKPTETTRDAYRFEVRLPEKGSAELPVTMERVYDNSISVTSGNNLGMLLSYVQNRAVSDGARRQLQAIADQKDRIAATETEKRTVTSQINAAGDDENRMRQNIQSLSGVAGQQQVVQDYARKLTDQETAIGKLRDRQSALDQQQTAQQARLNELIDALDF